MTAAAHARSVNITSVSFAQADEIVGRSAHDLWAQALVEYGEMGNRCLNARIIPGLLEHHLKVCANCREAHARWEGEKLWARVHKPKYPIKLKPKPFTETINLRSYR